MCSASVTVHITAINDATLLSAARHSDYTTREDEAVRTMSIGVADVDAVNAAIGVV